MVSDQTILLESAQQTQIS